MAQSLAQYDAYKKVDVGTASQGKLVVMLFEGAIKKAEQAKRNLAQGDLQQVHNNLIRAQEIIAELRASLDMKHGEIARNLDRLYEYFQHLLIKANVRKDSAPIDECLGHLEEMRNTWREAFSKVETERAPTDAPPRHNQHGSTLMNLQG